eukprot:1161677-Pelagomonas_calceolata.AAC.13
MSYNKWAGERGGGRVLLSPTARAEPAGKLVTLPSAPLQGLSPPGNRPHCAFWWAGTHGPRSNVRRAAMSEQKEEEAAFWAYVHISDECAMQGQ